MKIYNADKTQELNESELNYELGHTVPDKIVVAHHDATPFVAAKTAKEVYDELEAAGATVKIIGGKYYLVTATYPSGGEDLREIKDKPAVPAAVAYDDYEDILVYIPYTAEELQKIADDKRHAELKAELVKIKEDIEQEAFGLVRDDYELKKARAAEIVNELRVLEGKERREVRPSVL